MILTRKLINKFISNFNSVSDAQLIKALTALGLEIEQIIKHPVTNNCVIGKIIEIKKIIGSNQLSNCKVQVSKDKILNIVCGAKNLISNKKVIVALACAKLYNGLVIANRKICDVASEGMMCAYSELTPFCSFLLEQQKEEIIMFDDGEVGSNKWASIIGLDDTIYDVSAPANRNDFNSYAIICFELANKLGLKYNFKLSIKTEPYLNKETKHTLDPKCANAFNLLYYSEVKNFKTDWDLQSTLMNHQIKPVSGLIDQLSYISLITNCPTHVYNADKINGNIKCCLANKKSTFIALDNKTYDLNDNDVVIKDDSKIISLASIIGGQNSKMDGLKNLIIEIANFNYVKVRNTATRLNINTYASKISSKPQSIYLNLLTIELVKKILGIPQKAIYNNSINWNQKAIEITKEKLDSFFTEKISTKDIKNHIKKFGFSTLKNKIEIPKWRIDVLNQEDIFEEVLKNIDVNNLQKTDVYDFILPITDNTKHELVDKIKNSLINNYFNEVKTYNMTNKMNLNSFNLFNLKNNIEIKTSNQNRQWLRTSLIHNMLKVYEYNNGYKNKLLPIFEIQQIYQKDQKNYNLSILSLQKYQIDNTTDSFVIINVSYLKQVIKQIANILNATIEFKVTNHENFYENECLSILYNKKIIGYIGKIKKSLLKPIKLGQTDIYCASINLENLIKSFTPKKFKVTPIGGFQQLSKDINIEIIKNSHIGITDCISKLLLIPDVKDIEILKLFKKDNTSIYTIRYYLDDNKSYTTKDFDDINAKILLEISKALKNI